MQQESDDTNSEIVTRLVRYQVAWLKELDQPEAAVAAIQRLLEVENGDPESLAELVAWLIDEKAWKPIDDLAGRFSSKISKNPTLLYLLAEAQRKQSQEAKAKETAKLAFSAASGKPEEQLLQHLRLAQQLCDRGQFDWSRREYEHVADAQKPKELAVMARSFLAEMLHDQGQNLDAATTLEKIVKDLDSGKLKESNLYGRNPKEIRSRTYYFHACHWQSKGDAAKQREYLDKALEADPEDVDALIAAYRLADRREKAIELIRKAAKSLHKAIEEEPEDPSACNQFAWLVGNTEGDLDEALRCSLKSLELQPDEPAYFDTLAHVYFTKGDYANAVKFQEKAVKGDPHSVLIRQGLERFREKLNENK